MAKYGYVICIVALAVLQQYSASPCSPVILCDAQSRTEQPYNWFSMHLYADAPMSYFDYKAHFHASNTILGTPQHTTTSSVEAHDDMQSQELSEDAATANDASVAQSKPTCMICNKQFTYQTNVYRHIRSKHPQMSQLVVAKPYACTVAGCSKSYWCKGDLTQHLKSVHQQYKPTQYECRLCRNEFASLSDLYRHKITDHDKVFACNMCGRMSKNQLDLNAHKSSMHTLDGLLALVHGYNTNKLESKDQPYRCSVAGCNKSYKWLSRLRRHTQCHVTQPSVVVHSSKSPADSIDVQISPETTYTCRVCGEACHGATAMMMHIRTLHLGNATA